MTVADAAALGAYSAEIVSGAVSGGANTSHTIVVSALTALLDAVPADASPAANEHAVVEANVLGKATDGSRRRTYRYLRELYLLRPDSLLFRALRYLWPVDEVARPMDTDHLDALLAGGGTNVFAKSLCATCAGGAGRAGYPWASSSTSSSARVRWVRGPGRVRGW
jgi:hypothetical protein